MAESAFMTQYRKEFIAGFEQKISLLGSCVTREAVINGNSAVFLVADTGNASAVTRGLNGLIPARPDDLEQLTATLAEWHDKTRRTKFNIFASQGDGRRIMQQGTIKVINRKIDQEIITQLNTGTNDTGAARTASLDLVVYARAILGNNEVDMEEQDNLFFVITPAFEAYLMQIPEFASAKYVDIKPFVGPVRKMLRWAGFNWIVHSRLPGNATNAEKCFAYHRDAIGHAVDTAGMDVKAGENEEDAYFWARASLNMGSKLLQNAGVVVVNHDGSAYAAQ